MPNPVIRRHRGSENKYLLYDDFTTPFAAGAVNGTRPLIGGRRLIRDVESMISIVGGVETWAAQATPVYAEQDRVYDQLVITRAFGVVVICKYSPTTVPTAGHFPLALVTSVTPSWSNFANVQAGFDNSGTAGLYAVCNAAVANSPIVAILTTGVDYLLAIELRAAGAKWYIKGGAFVNWTKLFEHTLGSTATLYVASAGYTSVFTLDDVRLPARKIQFAPLASDSFAGSSGSMDGRLTDGLGHAEANGGGGLVWTATTWTVDGAGAAVNTPTLGAELASGNLVVGTWYSITATTADYFYTGNAVGDTFRATATTALDATHKVKAITLSTIPASVVLATVNVTGECVIKTLVAGTQAGFVARLNNAATPTSGIVGYWNGAGNIKLDEFTAAATWTNLLNTVKAYATGDKLVPWLNGTAWRLYHVTAAGVATLLGSGTTTVTTGFLCGEFDTYSGNAIESCVWSAVGAENQYNAFDALV